MIVPNTSHLSCFFIVYGEVEVVDTNMEQLYTLKGGDFFGEVVFDIPDGRLVDAAARLTHVLLLATIDGWIRVHGKIRIAIV